jgi:predicted dehydrogenase
MTGYSVGVVGCGTMGKSHARAYRACDETEIVATADLDADARATFVEEFDVPAAYETHAAMLAAEDLDLVSVCTLHSTHAEITIDAAEAGAAGIYCEKPMATSLGEAEDMLDAARRNDAKLSVGHQRRFDPVQETARELIAEGAIGEPRTVATRKDGGLLNWGTHMIDMTRFLLGDPDYEWVMGAVERRTDRHERRLAIEDRCVGQICFEDGTRLTHENDMPGPEYADASLQVSGTGGVLDLDLGSSVAVVNEEGRTEYAPSADGLTRAAQVAEFLEWIEGDREDHRCSGAHAREVTEIMMAIYESVRTRGLVSAPMQTRASPLERMIADGDLPVEHPGAYDIRLPYASIRTDE